jgi:hypothetical protein
MKDVEKEGFKLAKIVGRPEGVIFTKRTVFHACMTGLCESTGRRRTRRLDARFEVFTAVKFQVEVF